MRALRAVACLVAAAALAGCTPDGFDPPSHLAAGEVRLLAVVAEPPELAPGESAQLTAYAVAPGGADVDAGVASDGGRAEAALDYAWWRCTLAPSAVEDVNPACAAATGAPTLVAFAGDAHATFTMPSLDAHTLGAPDATDGVYVPLRLDVSAPATPASDATGIYRLRFGLGITGLVPNHNPRFADVVRVDGGGALLPLDENAPTHVPREGPLTLRARFTPESIERYLVLDPNDLRTPLPVDETLTVAWYATGGLFASDATGATRGDADAGSRDEVDGDQTLRFDGRYAVPSGGAVELWLVAHDERGGTAVAHRTLIVD